MVRARVARSWVVVVAALAVVSCGVPEPRSDSETGSGRAESAAAPWVRLDPPVDLPRDRPLAVGFLIVEGVYNTELTAPYDIFHHTPFHTDPDPGMRVFTISPDGETVSTFEGLRIVADYSFDDAPEIDLLVVPSAEGSMGRDLENERMIDWVRRTGEHARFVISLCDGAFVLAKAGLLDGHAVTTFPGDQDRFGRTFPKLDLRRGPSLVHDRRILTSQGGAKSFDVAMYLVDHLYGEQVARGVGRGLIIDWPPDRELVSVLVVTSGD